MSESSARRIVASLALSPRAEAVAGEAGALARRLDAALSFVHVGSDTAETRAGLDTVLVHVFGAEAPPYEVRSGDAAQVICSFAAEQRAGLIVAGALEREGFRERLRGSVARRIARNAPCDVLLILEPRREGTVFERVVVGLEGEPDSDYLADAIAFIRRTGGRHVDFVLEHETRLSRLGVEASPRVTLDHAIENTERLNWESAILDAGIGGLTHEIVGLEGRYAIETLAHADRSDADLLVMALPHRRLTFWDRFFHESAENLLEHLPCAALLHRGREGGEPWL